MYGFQPKHARGKPAQALADGGLVHSITGMLGMRKKTPEEMLAADAKVQERNREAAARVAARAKPAQQAAPAEEKAVSSYAGMSAMQRREKELGLKDGGIVGGFKPGGLIRGPGTGTSDSIETEKRPGTFIMPADSTQAIGPEALQSLGAPKGMPEAEGMEEPGNMDDRDEPEGEKVPVRLSNGEFELPPEQVQALGEAVLTVMRNATHQPAGGQKEAPTGKGFTPHQFFSGGGTVQDEERLKRVNQIPVGSDVQAPAPTGQDSTEFSRNVNNSLNALGGMGAVASVPLRAGQAAKAAATGSGATALPSGIPRLTGPAQAAAAPAADFVAGMGPGATTYANTIPRIGNAPTQALPAVNAALQQGAQANVMSAATRTASGANAGATALDSTQRNNPVAAPAPAPATSPPAATQSEYGRQMSAVGGALVDGAAWLGKTIVSAPGYGFNKPSAAPAPAVATATAGAGRGSINPASVNPTQPAAAATEQTNAATDTAAAPTQPPTNEVMPGVYRHGRGQYSDNAAGMAMPAGFTGQPSAQNMVAADALQARQTPAGFQPAGSPQASVQPPVVRNSTNDWAARNALRNAEVSASSITNRPEWQSGSTTQAWSTRSNGVADPQGKVAAYRAAVANDQALQQAQPGMDKAAMDGNTALQREGIQQAGATGRTAMQEQGANAREAGRNAMTAEELGLKREAAGFQTRAAKRSESAYDNYSKAKTDEDRQAIAKQFPDLFGQAKDAAHRMEVVRGKTDPMTGQSSGDYVVVQDPKTGEVRQIQMGAAPAPQAMPKPASKAEFDALPKGTRFTDPNGQVRIK